jgi:hypothetical protein
LEIFEVDMRKKTVIFPTWTQPKVLEHMIEINKYVGVFKT